MNDDRFLIDAADYASMAFARGLLDEVYREEALGYDALVPGDLVGLSKSQFLDLSTHGGSITTWTTPDVDCNSDEHEVGMLFARGDEPVGMIVSDPRSSVAQHPRAMARQVLVASFYDGSIGWCELGMLRRL